MASEQDIINSRQTVPEPRDFDAFWQGVRRQLSAAPLETEFTQADLRCTPTATVHEVRFTSLGGVRIACWYVVPRGEGPFPALISFPGYQGEPRLIREWASQGVISLSVAYRGKLRSSARFNPGYPGFMLHGIEDQDNYAYRGVYADAMRAVDFLLSRPEVDATRLVVHGISGGGGLAIVTMGLCPAVKAGVAGCPFMCAIGDAIGAVRTYPYNEVVCYLRAHPERREQVLNTLAYFDAVNFAKRVDRPMAVQIGMEDEVCPPQTSYAAFAALRGKKEVWLAPGVGHGSFPGYPDWETTRLRDFLGLGTSG